MLNKLSSVMPWTLYRDYDAAGAPRRGAFAATVQSALWVIGAGVIGVTLIGAAAEVSVGQPDPGPLFALTVLPVLVAKGAFHAGLLLWLVPGLASGLISRYLIHRLNQEVTELATLTAGNEATARAIVGRLPADAGTSAILTLLLGWLPFGVMLGYSRAGMNRSGLVVSVVQLGVGCWIGWTIATAPTGVANAGSGFLLVMGWLVGLAVGLFFAGVGGAIVAAIHVFVASIMTRKKVLATLSQAARPDQAA